jgi:hypothetical protein
LDPRASTLFKNVDAAIIFTKVSYSLQTEVLPPSTTRTAALVYHLTVEDVTKVYVDITSVHVNLVTYYTVTPAPAKPAESVHSLLLLAGVPSGSTPKAVFQILY